MASEVTEAKINLCKASGAQWEKWEFFGHEKKGCPRWESNPEPLVYGTHLPNLTKLQII